MMTKTETTTRNVTDLSRQYVVIFDARSELVTATVIEDDGRSQTQTWAVADLPAAEEIRSAVRTFTDGIAAAVMLANGFTEETPAP